MANSAVVRCRANNTSSTEHTIFFPPGCVNSKPQLFSVLFGQRKVPVPRTGAGQQHRHVQSAGALYIRLSDVAVICDHIAISMLWGNTAYCVELSGEDLSRYSNKIESVGLRKCPYYDYLSNKVMSQ